MVFQLYKQVTMVEVYQLCFTLDENNNIVQSEGNTRKLYEEGAPVNKVVEEKVMKLMKILNLY